MTIKELLEPARELSRSCSDPLRAAALVQGLGAQEDRHEVSVAHPLGPLQLAARMDGSGLRPTGPVRHIDQGLYECVTSILGTMGLAVFICDRDSRILAANALAHQGVTTFLFGHRPSARAFKAALRANFSDIVVLNDQHQQVHLRFCSLDLFTSSRLGLGAVLVTMTHLRTSPEASMAQQFGLTKTEVRIVQELFAGETVKNIAEIHQVKADTVRTQLKSIYAKTSTGRQSQLVALYAKAHAAEAFDEFPPMHRKPAVQATRPLPTLAPTAKAMPVLPTT